MKIIIFAGGTGTRLWPLSRKNSPKQFSLFVGEKSTLQMAVSRVRSFGLENIYISTNQNYVETVREQVPELSEKNILSEPAKRDLAAAVALALWRLKKAGVRGTVALLWADHLMKHEDNFVLALKEAQGLVRENSKQIVFLGEEPRFANHNLGWIKLGKHQKDNQYDFLQWRYRPELTQCREMFDSGDWVWNSGYFIFDLDFVLSLYRRLMPKMYEEVEAMSGDEKLTKEKYHTLEAVSFDNAILEKIETDQATVLKVDLGWSDPGTLYALKEALAPETAKNCEQGLVLAHDTRDSLICNEDRDKLVAVVGLDGMVVVNTREALLVCHKDEVPKVKELLEEIEKKGLNKYL